MAEDIRFNPEWEKQLIAAARPKLRQLAEAITEDAYRAAPVDTGEMRSTIRWYSVSGGRYRVRVGSDHWQYVEYGTRKMSAQPFMRPAFHRRRSL